MSASTPNAQPPPVVSVRRLPAIKPSKSNPSKWEVSYGSEDHGWKVIGWIEQRTLRRGHTTFYFAIGIHPQTGKHYRLEGHTDFDDRVNTIADFHIDPMTCRQHLGADVRHCLRRVQGHPMARRPMSDGVTPQTSVSQHPHAVHCHRCHSYRAGLRA